MTREYDITKIEVQSAAELGMTMVLSLIVKLALDAQQNPLQTVSSVSPWGCPASGVFCPAFDALEPLMVSLDFGLELGSIPTGGTTPIKPGSF